MKSALQLAGNSDVVIMTLGELSGMDFEYASRSSLSLPGKQPELLQSIQALGKPVVLLLFSTRPLDISWASEHIPAIMDCYFGGTETGNAVADLLAGDTVPGGKLPLTWPRNVGRVPIYYAPTTPTNRMTPRTSPLVTGPSNLASLPLWLRGQLFDFHNLRSSSKCKNLSFNWLDHGDGNGCEYWYKSSGRSRSTLSASAFRFGIETGS
jgi:beta-glucosidase